MVQALRGQLSLPDTCLAVAYGQPGLGFIEFVWFSSSVPGLCIPGALVMPVCSYQTNFYSSFKSQLNSSPKGCILCHPITVSSHVTSQVPSHLCLYQIIVLHCHCCTSSHPTRLLAGGDSHYNWGSSLDPQDQAYRMAESKCSGSVSWIVKLPVHEMLTTIVVNSLLLEIEFHDLQSKTLVWCHQYT